ncbi:haloacid dehalogenase-like hydrolase [Kitasatospora aureofaciens]|uniref:HAD family hydrolase n=1 Tax=Kitasatospora aureofaciens TaxID=1894 RepID=UPI001C4451BA|nr:HAD hydrolase-like protein [Kitasatospora aureofaciens]MBV6695663.1 haloacid dehalogenase-like hydrolase [Kitasatospora aureofaciens]
MTSNVLVLWDVDRTLVYVGETDRAVYREAFLQAIGREATRLPERGTGRTMPLAVRELLAANGIDHQDVERLAERIVQLLPQLLAKRSEQLRDHGQIMAGAPAALEAVHVHPDLVPTVVTGNLQRSAEIKLRAFNLDQYVDLAVGGFASDDSHRPALVGIAQRRVAARYGTAFGPSNTVIIGDSLEDVRTGAQGGARVIAVASGTTSADQLAAAGADHVLDSLSDTQALLRAIADLTTARRQ